MATCGTGTRLNGADSAAVSLRVGGRRMKTRTMKPAGTQEKFDTDLIAFRNAHIRDAHFVLVDPARARPLNVLVKQLRHTL